MLPQVEGRRLYEQWRCEAMGQPWPAFWEWFRGLTVTPQFVDWHWHFRREHWENKFNEDGDSGFLGKQRTKRAKLKLAAKLATPDREVA